MACVGFHAQCAGCSLVARTLPVVQTTPSHTLEYFRCPGILTLTGDNLRASIDVRARSDVHIGLKRTSGTGPSFEIVLGGGGNAISAIRTFASGDELANVAGRAPDVEGVKCASTP